MTSVFQVLVPNPQVARPDSVHSKPDWLLTKSRLELQQETLKATGFSQGAFCTSSPGWQYWISGCESHGMCFPTLPSLLIMSTQWVAGAWEASLLSCAVNRLWPQNKTALGSFSHKGQHDLPKERENISEIPVSEVLVSASLLCHKLQDYQ